MDMYKSINKLNNINKLSTNLKRKFDEYLSNSTSRISEYFSFEEFVELFTVTTLQWYFRYKETVFGLTNFGNIQVERGMSCEFFNESNHEDAQLFVSPKELFDNVRINNKTLQEIWLEVYDC